MTKVIGNIICGPFGWLSGSLLAAVWLWESFSAFSDSTCATNFSRERGPDEDRATLELVLITLR